MVIRTSICEPSSFCGPNK